MDNKVSAIFFDWGRTLHNPETDTLFEGVKEMLEDLSRKFSLVLVSLAKSDSPENRKKKIEESGISKYFDLILVGGKNKDEMYDRALDELGLEAKNVLVIDDRVCRGISWGNRKGAVTIWLKKGKFATELPTNQTGFPDKIIENITGLKDLV